MTKRGFAYYRVSSTGQESGSGFDRQSSIVKEYCAKNGIELIGEYSETKTGTTEYRPTFERMLAEIESVDFIVVERVDRLSRDLGVQEILIRELGKKGKTIISATEGHLDDDPTRKLVRQLLGAVAGYEKSRIVEKLKISREKIRKEKGKCEGSKSYQEIDPSLVDSIRTMREQGDKLQDIADWLNANKIPCKRGGAVWYPSSVRSVLLASKKDFVSPQNFKKS